MSKAAENTRTNQQRLIDAGLCVICRKPRDGKSLWRCKACLRKMADKQKERAKLRPYFYKPNEQEEGPAVPLDRPSTVELNDDDAARYQEVRRHKTSTGP